MNSRKPSSDSVLSEEYIEKLHEQFPPEIAAQFNQKPNEVLLPHTPGKTLKFIKIEPRGTPIANVLYVPGFTEGITAKAPFAAALATAGVRVILPDQNRRGLVRDKNGKADATLSQARNYAALAEAVGFGTNEGDYYVPHSYGSLILGRMVEDAEAKHDMTNFENAGAIVLAPAGSNPHENRLSLLKRFQKGMADEGRVPKDFSDTGNQMLLAGAARFASNLHRTYLEMSDLAAECVDYGKLKDTFQHLTVFGYAHDGVYPHDAIGGAILDAGVSYAVPIDYEPVSSAIDNGTEPRLGRFATHNDEQFHPTRVASAVAAVIKSNHSRLAK